MSRVNALRSVPLAIGYWIGIVGKELRHNGHARILTFHGTPAAQARALERQLRYLRRQFDIVPLRTLVDAIAQGRAGLGTQIAITFDDGLRNNVDTAYPILKQLRIPATFFVCPGLVDQDAWIWNMEMRQRLRVIAPGELTELARELGVAPNEDGFVEWMKTLPLASRLRVEAKVRDASSGFRPGASAREECDLANWDELRTLDTRLVTIGSHSMTHPILSYSTAREIETEVAGSRPALEARLQRSVDLFAYPNGDQNPLVRECAGRHYAAAFTTVQTWIGPGCDLHRLPRVGAPRGAIRLSWNMHLPVYLPCES